MVMEVMELFEPSKIRYVREPRAAAMLQVMHDGKIVVLRVQSENQKGGRTGGKHQGEHTPDGQRNGRDHEERRADERSGIRMMLEVAALCHRRWAMEDPPVQDVLEQSRYDEPSEHHGHGRNRLPGEAVEPDGQKCQRRDQVAVHRGPIVGGAADDPVQSAEQDSSGLNGHLHTTSYTKGGPDGY